MGLQKTQESNQITNFINDLLTRFRKLEDRLALIEGDEGARYLKLSEDNVSNPPTDAQLDALYGTPAVVGKGFVALINDNGVGANFYLVTSDGSAWWVFTGTVAA